MESRASARHRRGRLFREGSVYTLGTGLQLSAAALAIPVVTRILGPAEYGTVALAITLQLLLATLASLGLPPAILRFFFDDGQHGRESARRLIPTSAVASLVVVGALLATGVAWIPAVAEHNRGALVLGSLLALPTTVLGACWAFLRAEERPYAYVLLVLVASVGAQSLGIAALIATPRPAAYLAGCLVAVTLAAVAAMLLTGAFRMRPADGSTFRAALRYGMPTVPHSVSMFVLAFGDRAVIAAIAGSAAVGRYQVAFVFGFLGVTLLQSLQVAWVPMTFAAPDRERWRSLADAALPVARLAACVCGILALSAEPVFSLLVPSDYEPRLLGDVAAVVALSTVAWATYLSRTQVLLWTKRTRPLSWISPGAAALNLALVAMLLPPFGLRGAALATVGAVVVQAYLTSRAAAAAAHVPWHWRSELSAYGTAAGLTAVALLLPDGAWALGIRVGVAAVVAAVFVRTIARELRIGREGADPAVAR